MASVFRILGKRHSFAGQKIGFRRLKKQKFKSFLEQKAAASSRHVFLNTL